MRNGTIKKLISAMALGLVLFLSGWNASGQTAAETPQPSLPSAQGEQDRLQRLADNVAEVRRDQLTYQIERDLLKETYSSNLQTVNLVVTIVLGAFAVVGYLGVRSIGALRVEFERDLEQFRTTRRELEQQLGAVKQEQSQAVSDLDKIRTENEEQERRLRGLEVREKVSTLVKEGLFPFALEYIQVGLRANPDDRELLRFRAHCEARLNNIDAAIVTYECLIQLEPTDTTTAQNLAEYYLVAGRIEDHDRFAATHRTAILQRGPLTLYFTAFKSFLRNDVAGVKEQAIALLGTSAPDAAPKLPGWGFIEARALVSARQDLGTKTLFLAFLDFLEGRIDASVLNGLVAPEGAPAQ